MPSDSTIRTACPATSSFSTSPWPAAPWAAASSSASPPIGMSGKAITMTQAADSPFATADLIPTWNRLDIVPSESSIAAMKISARAGSRGSMAYGAPIFRSALGSTAALAAGGGPVETADDPTGGSVMVTAGGVVAATVGANVWGAAVTCAIGAAV